MIAWEAVQRLGDPPGVDGAGRAGRRPRGRRRQRRGRLGALARRAALAQRRGRPRARARRPLRLARGRAGRPARADRRAGARRRDRRAAGRRADGPLGFSLLGQATRVLLEAAPRGIDPDAVGHALAAHPGVREVHDLHVWEVTSGFAALSAHVLVPADATATPAARSSSSCSPSASGSSTPRCRSSTRPARPAGHHAAVNSTRGFAASASTKRSSASPSAASSSASVRGSRSNGVTVSVALSRCAPAPAAGREPVDQERRLDAQVPRRQRLAVLVGDHARAVCVREQQAVELGQEAWRRRRVRRGPRRVGQVEQRAAAGREDRQLVAHALQHVPDPAQARPGLRHRRRRPARRRQGGGARAPRDRRRRVRASSQDSASVNARRPGTTSARGRAPSRAADACASRSRARARRPRGTPPRAACATR